MIQKIVSVFFLFPILVLAEENAASDKLPPLGGMSVGVYLQGFFSLIFILALLVGAAWLLRKLVGGKSFGQGQIKVLGGVVLGPKERLVLVEVGDECLVVGIVPGQIRTLHKLPKTALASLTSAEETPKPLNFNDFLSRLRQKNP